MRKAINFDIDTKKYEEITGKKAPTAYAQIKIFLRKYDFEHRQGSGYVSKNSLNDGQIFAIIQDMSMKLDWLRNSVKQIDVTNIGKQHSLVDAINKAPTGEDLSDLNDIEI
ncbi:MAG: hypothetical protein IKF97_04875 [Clostridia bacterium]|nr:hypothetical protein [Clostridia bacterium]